MLWVITSTHHLLTKLRFNAALLQRHSFSKQPRFNDITSQSHKVSIFNAPVTDDATEVIVELLKHTLEVSLYNFSFTFTKNSSKVVSNIFLYFFVTSNAKTKPKSFSSKQQQPFKQTFDKIHVDSLFLCCVFPEKQKSFDNLCESLSKMVNNGWGKFKCSKFK